MQPDGIAPDLVIDRVSYTRLDEVANTLLTRMRDVKVCVLLGEMGAGKTTLVKAFGKALGVVDTMASPTFSLVNEYATASGTKLYHFDLYRLKSANEVFDIGAEEYLYSGHFCFVEWPEKITSLLPDNYAEIRILTEDEHYRTIEFLLHGRKEEKRV
ncbi:MAG: tRNA (adenosine(37)-N6)-threonylcarbamoyltransferase complex ATPase subunit type 1 TsaE [Cyclobacteriaceae bacterium]|nr:tRNA (adenosine(37)-N6)-threonylcarbamoyltransferase complex ATPase subunit type 1 TsaE [Cyclobacteriaceae bacterium]